MVFFSLYIITNVLHGLQPYYQVVVMQFNRNKNETYGDFQVFSRPQLLTLALSEVQPNWSIVKADWQTFEI